MFILFDNAFHNWRNHLIKFLQLDSDSIVSTEDSTNQRPLSQSDFNFMLSSLMFHFIEDPIDSSRVDKLMLINSFHLILTNVILHSFEDESRSQFFLPFREL